MRNIGTRMIETERLVLRRFTIDDAEPMFKNWASDSDVTEFLTWQPHASVEATVAVLSDWIRQYENDDFYLWAIVPNDFAEPIGNIAVVKQDDKIAMVHVGYCIGKNWWHNGIMSEALAALLEYFFTKTDINRVESSHDPNNPNSGKVMLKCGLKFEGTLRQADISNKGVVDASIYSILAEEYFAK